MVGRPSMELSEKKRWGSSATATGSSSVSKNPVSQLLHCGTLSASRERWKREKNCTLWSGSNSGGSLVGGASSCAVPTAPAIDTTMTAAIAT